MKPYKSINVGDIYKNPITKYEWLVVDKDDSERMIGIRLISTRLPSRLNPVVWKKSTDHIFNQQVL